MDAGGVQASGGNQEAAFLGLRNVTLLAQVRPRPKGGGDFRKCVRRNGSLKIKKKIHMWNFFLPSFPVGDHKIVS